MIIETPIGQSQALAPQWQQELRFSLRTATDLLRAGFITAAEVPAYESLLTRFQMLIPPYYAALIDRNDPKCPIRLQAIPSLQESAENYALQDDPLSDLAYQPAPRVTHRYRSRALLHLTPLCSMYCRFCFRKSLLNELSHDLFAGSLEESFRYFASHPEIEEVILTGGDPLMLPDGTLLSTIQRLCEVPHLKRVRIHTRVPVTLPSRVTETLASGFKSIALPVALVTHFNHPKELTEASALCCERVRNSGISLWNQSVLLRGVNDSAAILRELFVKLAEADITSYYLHHPDRASGTGHFDLSLEEGIALYRQVKAELPGYLVPRYVIDIVGKPNKMDVESYYAENQN